MRNWQGALIGALIGILPLIPFLGFGNRVFNQIVITLLKPMEFIVCRILNQCKGGELAGLGLSIILLIMIFALLGAFIQSQLRRYK